MLFVGEKSVGICFISPCNAAIMNVIKPKLIEFVKNKTNNPQVMSYLAIAE